MTGAGKGVGKLEPMPCQPDVKQQRTHSGQISISWHMDKQNVVRPYKLNCVPQIHMF